MSRRKDVSMSFEEKSDRVSQVRPASPASSATRVSSDDTYAGFASGGASSITRSGDGVKVGIEVGVDSLTGLGSNPPVGVILLPATGDPHAASTRYRAPISIRAEIIWK